jgi:hypothetical protein
MPGLMTTTSLSNVAASMPQAVVQAFDGELRRMTLGAERLAELASHRCDIDDSARPLRAHHRQRELAQARGAAIMRATANWFEAGGAGVEPTLGDYACALTPRAAATSAVKETRRSPVRVAPY